MASGYKLTIRRYDTYRGNVVLDIHVPARVTITGRENHFARAYEDAEMVLAGLRAMDAALGLNVREREGKEPEDLNVIYDITALTAY